MGGSEPGAQKNVVSHPQGGLREVGTGEKGQHSHSPFLPLPVLLFSLLGGGPAYGATVCQTFPWTDFYGRDLKLGTHLA